MFDSNFLQNISNHFAGSVNIFLPEIALLITFILALFMDVIFKKVKSIAGYTVCIGFAATAVLLVYQGGNTNINAFVTMISVDPFAHFFKYLILLASFVVVLMSFFSDEIYKDERKVGEYYSLIAGMTFGMFILVGASNLIMIYIAVEILSLSSYVLAGFTKEIKRASEASLKYVIYGSVSSGIMVYGMSIMFGLTGTLNLFDLSTILASGHIDTLPLVISGLMILSGFGYKISAVPFHFWTPDVYEGAPVTITAFLSVSSKAAGFGALIRFVVLVLARNKNIDWQIVIAVLSVLTMTLGNLVAIWQTNAKRLLAYSSIAHAGYMLMALVVMNQIGIASIMIYMFMYLFMNIGAFAVVMLIANKTGNEDIDSYNGLGYKMPVLSICMVVFLISLAGIPPTGGFVGKLYVFTALFNSGTQWLWLAIIGVINSVISLFYYAKIFRNMYLRGTDYKGEVIRHSPIALTLVILLAIPTVLFGVYFGPIVDWANASAAIFFVK
jgi:NADH-quinone oxidoreductase subunit N